MTERRLLLLDATGILVRCERAARRATPMHAAVDGAERPTGALLMFIRSVARYLREDHPTHVLAAWDGERATAGRRELHPGYKSSRPQPPGEDSWLYQAAMEFVREAWFYPFRREGLEADDIIAWACQAVPLSADLSAVIRSDDHDLFQLLRPGRVIQRSLNSLSERTRASDVVKRYGCQPVWLPALWALAGDKADDIPGIPGVGNSKALKLLEEADWRFDDVRHPWLESEERGWDMIGAYREILDLAHWEPGRRERHWLSHEMWTEMVNDRRWDPAAALRRVRPLLEKWGMTGTLSDLESGKLWPLDLDS